MRAKQVNEAERATASEVKPLEKPETVKAETVAPMQKPVRVKVEAQATETKPVTAAMPEYPDIEKMSRADIEKELPQVRDRIAKLKQNIRESVAGAYREATKEQLNREYDRAGKLQNAIEFQDARAAKATEKRAARTAKKTAPKEESRFTVKERERNLEVDKRIGAGIKELTPVESAAGLGQREYFEKSIAGPIKAWTDKLGPERIEEARKLTRKAQESDNSTDRDKALNALRPLETEKPEGFPEGKLHIAVPGDGDFTIRNRPGVLAEIAKRTEEMFPNQKTTVRPLTKPRRINVREGTEKQIQSAIEAGRARVDEADRLYRNPESGVKFETYEEKKAYMDAELENIRTLEEHLAERKQVKK
jgi:hypothetical protein